MSESDKPQVVIGGAQSLLGKFAWKPGIGLRHKLSSLGPKERAQCESDIRHRIADFLTILGQLQYTGPRASMGMADVDATLAALGQRIAEMARDSQMAPELDEVG